VPTDPFMSFQFTVKVDTKNGTQVVGGFSDVTGLGAETEVQPLRVGGLNEAEVMLTDGQQKMAWTFKEACPVKWSGPELHAATSAVGFESIELVHKGFLRPDV